MEADILHLPTFVLNRHDECLHRRPVGLSKISYMNRESKTTRTEKRDYLGLYFVMFHFVFIGCFFRKL